MQSRDFPEEGKEIEKRRRQNVFPDILTGIGKRTSILPVFPPAAGRNPVSVYKLLPLTQRHLTAGKQRASILSKLNRLDRGAVRISTFWHWQGSRRKGKGSPPKWKTITLSFLLGRQRISAGLSQDFVKRYHWLFGNLLYFDAVFPWTAYQSGPVFVLGTSEQIVCC